MSWYFPNDPLWDVQTTPPAGYCRCGAELYGDEALCQECEREHEDGDAGF